MARQVAGETQLAGQPVLKGAPETLDAALGLRRTRQDESHPQLVEETAELGGSPLAGELLLERGSSFAHHEDGVLVGVQRMRDAVSLDDLAHDDEVALRILLLAKAGGGDQTGRVVDSAHQAQVRTTPFQPVVAAAVDLQEHALPRVPIAPLPVAWWSASTWCWDAGVREDASHRRARQDQPLVLGKHLGEVMLVESGVRRGRQLDNARCERTGERVGRWPTPIAVDERLDAAVTVRSADTAELPEGDAEQWCGLCGFEAPRLEVNQDGKSSLFGCGQGDASSHAG